MGKPVSSMYVPRNIVTDLKWIVKEKSVIQASEDKTLRVWDLTSCSTVQHFRARNYLQVSSYNYHVIIVHFCKQRRAVMYLVMVNNFLLAVVAQAMN